MMYWPLVDPMAFSSISSASLSKRLSENALADIFPFYADDPGGQAEEIGGAFATAFEAVQNAEIRRGGCGDEDCLTLGGTQWGVGWIRGICWSGEVLSDDDLGDASLGELRGRLSIAADHQGSRDAADPKSGGQSDECAAGG